MIAKVKTLLKDVVLLRLPAPKTVSESGLIFLPEKQRQGIELVEGEVLQIGSKFRFKDDVKVGDSVLVPSHFGNVLNSDEPLIKMFDGEDVHGIVTRTT